MTTIRDWSKPQHCRECGRRMRSSWMKLADCPGTVQYAGRGVCKSCASAAERAGRRRGDCVRHKPGRRGGNPTVAELAAQGHPCIEPAPMPSRTRSYPL